MKVKTSITLSEDVLQKIQDFAAKGDRSAFVEQAIWKYLAVLARQKQNSRDAAIYDDKAVALNTEAEDTLGYQAPI